LPENKNPLDEMFRQSLDRAELTAPSGVWEGISAGIGSGAATTTTSTATSWLSAGWIKASIAVIMLGGAAWGARFLLNKKETTTPPFPAVHTTNKSEKTAKATDAEKFMAADPSQPKLSGKAQPVIALQSVRPGKTFQADNQPQQPSDIIPGTAQPRLQAQESNPITPETSTPPPSRQDPCSELPEAVFNHREVQPGVVDFNAGEGNRQEVRWSFGDGREGNGSALRHTFLSGNRFRVKLELTDGNGCLRRGEKDILLTGSELEGNLLIPNVFTPNSDGINDPYRVLIVGQEKYRLSIYDRAGKVLHTSTEPEEGWDGMINGQPAPVGPYIARVEWQFYGHEPQNKTVVIMLKR